jgi:hypothetical protein
MNRRSHDRPAAREAHVDHPILLTGEGGRPVSHDHTIDWGGWSTWLYARTVGWGEWSTWIYLHAHTVDWGGCVRPVSAPILLTGEGGRPGEGAGSRGRSDWWRSMPGEMEPWSGDKAVDAARKAGVKTFAKKV